MARVDKERIGFMNLSAELRNNIYELVLTSQIPIRIFDSYTRNKDGGNSYSWSSKIASDLEGRSYSSFLVQWTQSPSLSPNLLATCKEVHQEATAMLYGQNRFVITSVSSLEAPLWTSVIGGSLRYLRNVILSHSYCSPLAHEAALLASLRGATCLQKVVVDRSFTFSFPTPEKMAKALQPLVLWLHRNRKDTNLTPALEVLEVGESWYNSVDWSPKTVELLQKKLDDHQKRLDAKKKKKLEAQKDKHT